MKRGDLITIAISGDYGKPRPALIVQADLFEAHPSLVVLPLTSELHDAPLFRITVKSGAQTGLRKDSQIMVDKITTIPRAKAGQVIGRVDAETMRGVGESLSRFLALQFKPFAP